MKTLNRTLYIARRTLALSAVLGAGLVAAHAQQAATAATDATEQPKLNLQLPAAEPVATFSSSSQDDSAQANAVAVADNHFDFLAVTNAQPPRGRYGRPRYRGGNTNPDGSNKYAFIAGVGFTVPTDITSNDLKTSWGLQVGAGRNFNKNFGLLVQFDYDKFGFTNQALQNQLIVENNQNVFNGQITQLNGDSHVWSFTLDPTFTIYSGEGMGAYVVGGVGFYHKTANFSVPVEEEDVYGDIYSANQTIDKYTSNAPGFNGGFGLTYKFSRFSNERFYAEVRYVYVDNSARPGFTVANATSIQTTSTNLYPANSNHTTYVPIKFGIRF